MRRTRMLAVVRLVGFWAAALYAASIVSAQPAQKSPGTQGLRVQTSSRTGVVSFVRARAGGAIPVAPAVLGQPLRAEDFLDQYGNLFSVTDRQQQLRIRDQKSDALGFTHTTFEQVHNGVPVFTGVLKVHQRGDGEVIAANGDVYPIPRGLSTIPTLPAEVCTAIAVAKLGLGQPTTETVELVIADPGWYGEAPIGPHLTYYVVLSDLVNVVREAFLIDANNGAILDHWSMIHNAKDRQIHDGLGGGGLPGLLVRGEGDPAVGVPIDVDRAYDYYGDTYDYYFRAFGRDSIDDLGAPMIATVNSTAPGCPNAFWNGVQMAFCLGTVTDDVVGHELTHGVTQNTSGLIYKNQPGQLNESLSDIFGELVDMFNGNAAFAGPPGGPPFWPAHPTGPGLDTPNNARTGLCSVSGPKLQVTAPADIEAYFRVGTATFGPALTFVGVGGNIVAADPPLACNGDLPLNDAELSGNIALIDRGICAFTEKVKNAQNAGAIAVIVVNTARSPSTMTGVDATIVIPSAMVGHAHGNLIRSRVELGTVSATLRNMGTAYDDGVRWVVGEDAAAFGGAIRDMWDPNCLAAPGSANDAFQICDPADNGGVHSGSGVPNHAFALMTDGGTFNGHTVSGIGPIKAGAVWYRAQTVYFTPGTHFNDAYLALNQAAADLIGTTPNDPRTGALSASMFTIADAVDVDEAMLAVEMDTQGACGFALVDTPPTTCNERTVIYYDSFENGVNGWTVSNSAPLTPYDWVQTTPLPLGRPGTGWFVMDPFWGDCDVFDESGSHSLLSPVIALPGSLYQPTLGFTHYFDTEGSWDGGNISVRVNAGPWQLIPASAFTYNNYNLTLVPAVQGNTNPLAGQPAWSFWGIRWGATRVDLTGIAVPGGTIQLRFDFGKDGCSGSDGWYIDDFEIYVCPDCNVAGICSDGNECTDDVCDPALGCVRTNNIASCEDGSACTENDVCSGGVCQTGSAVNCDDFNVCTDDDCNPVIGCVNDPNTILCDDNDACTTADTCSAGTCAGGPPPNCDDSNICTDDSCDTIIGCVNAANIAACDDGDNCTADDVCTGGICAGAPMFILFGDVTPPGGDGAIDVDDILFLLAAFSDEDPCENFPEANLQPCEDDCGFGGAIDVDDILAVLDAFSGNYACPHPCPP